MNVRCVDAAGAEESNSSADTEIGKDGERLDVLESMLVAARSMAISIDLRPQLKLRFSGCWLSERYCRKERQPSSSTHHL